MVDVDVVVDVVVVDVVVEVDVVEVDVDVVLAAVLVGDAGAVLEGGGGLVTAVAACVGCPAVASSAPLLHALTATATSTAQHDAPARERQRGSTHP